MPIEESKPFDYEEHLSEMEEDHLKERRELLNVPEDNSVEPVGSSVKTEESKADPVVPSHDAGPSLEPTQGISESLDNKESLPDDRKEPFSDMSSSETQEIPLSKPRTKIEEDVSEKHNPEMKDSYVNPIIDDEPAPKVHSESDSTLKSDIKLDKTECHCGHESNNDKNYKTDKREEANRWLRSNLTLKDHGENQHQHGIVVFILGVFSFVLPIVGIVAVYLGYSFRKESKARGINLGSLLDLGTIFGALGLLRLFIQFVVFIEFYNGFY